MSFRDCLSHALNDGMITKQEAEDLASRFEAIERAEIGPNGPAVAKAFLVDQLISQAKEGERVKLLQAKAATQIGRDVRRYAALRNQPDIVAATQALFENYGHAGFSSVQGTYRALLGAAHSEMADFLYRFRRSNVTLKRFERPLLEDVGRAAFGEGVSPEAKGLYQSWANVAEKLRGLYNEAGGHIQALSNWGLPQSHNAQAVIRAGFERWRDYIMPKLDWEKMQHGISGAAIREGQRDGVLHHVWDSIVTDGWNTREPSASGGGAALYNRRADARFLIFKDADSWLGYNRDFGKGDVFSTMMDHVRSMSKDIALMQRLGPNPAATVRWMKQLVESEGAKVKMDQPSLFPDTKAPLVDARVFSANRMLDGFYDVARGSGVPYSTTGSVLSIARNVQYSAKLGGAVILHTFSNPVIQAMGRYLQGHPVLSTPIEVLKSIGHDHELAQAGMILQDAVNTLERGAREQGSLQRVRELSNWLPTLTTHYSGLEAMVEANRRAAFLGQMTNFANHLGRDFDSLPERLRNVLQGFNIEASDWKVIQKAQAYESEKGAPMLRFQDIQAIGGASADKAAMKYLELLHQSTEVMVPSSNWRVRAATAFAQQGTLAGEIVKSALMFKGGFMATFMLTQMQSISREIARNGLGAGAAYVGASTIALTIAGMLTLQAKNLRAGKDLLSMDPTTGQGIHAWEHAFLTSGALGIYGDFIASDRSAYGHDLISTLAGPMVTGAEDLFHMGKHAIGAAMGGKDDPGKDVTKFLRNNTPVLSTHWALSAGYNRVIMDQLQYMSDPKAHQKMRQMEQRLQKETGQGYWWQPGQSSPGRAPSIAGAH